MKRNLLIVPTLSAFLLLVVPALVLATRICQGEAIPNGYKVLKEVWDSDCPKGKAWILEEEKSPINSEGEKPPVQSEGEKPPVQSEEEKLPVGSEQKTLPVQLTVENESSTDTESSGDNNQKLKILKDPE